MYIMLHKSAGVVTSTEDPWERTVLDLLPEELRRRGVFPVGRLDKDVTGLVLLTDDGPLGHRLTSPRHHVDKVYQVTVDGVLTKEDVGGADGRGWCWATACGACLPGWSGPGGETWRYLPSGRGSIIR